MDYGEALEAFNSAMESSGNLAEEIRNNHALRKGNQLSILQEELSQEMLPTAGEIKTEKVVQGIADVSGGVGAVVNTIHGYKMLAQKMKSTTQDKISNMKETAEDYLKPKLDKLSSETTPGTEAGTETDMQQSLQRPEGTELKEYSSLEGEPVDYKPLPKGEGMERPMTVEERYQQSKAEQEGRPYNPEDESIHINPEEAVKNLNPQPVETGEQATEGLGETLGKVVGSEGIEGSIETGALEAGLAGAGESLGTSLLIGGLVAGITSLGTELFDVFRPHHHHSTDATQDAINKLKNQGPDLSSASAGVGFGFTQSTRPTEEELF